MTDCSPSVTSPEELASNIKQIAVLGMPGLTQKIP